MSETFKATAEGFRRLKAALSEADQDTRDGFAFWCIGLCLMGSATVVQFGWAGFLFCCGAVLYFSSGLKK
jgi:hypothetical protein